MNKGDQVEGVVRAGLAGGSGMFQVRGEWGGTADVRGGYLQPTHGREHPWGQGCRSR